MLKVAAAAAATAVVFPAAAASTAETAPEQKMLDAGIEQDVIDVLGSMDTVANREDTLLTSILKKSAESTLEAVNQNVLVWMHAMETNVQDDKSDALTEKRLTKNLRKLENEIATEKKNISEKERSLNKAYEMLNAYQHAELQQSVLTNNVVDLKVGNLLDMSKCTQVIKEVRDLINHTDMTGGVADRVEKAQAVAGTSMARNKGYVFTQMKMDKTALVQKSKAQELITSLQAATTAEKQSKENGTDQLDDAADYVKAAVQAKQRMLKAMDDVALSCRESKEEAYNAKTQAEVEHAEKSTMLRSEVAREKARITTAEKSIAESRRMILEHNAGLTAINEELTNLRRERMERKSRYAQVRMTLTKARREYVRSIGAVKKLLKIASQAVFKSMTKTAQEVSGEIDATGYTNGGDAAVALGLSSGSVTGTVGFETGLLQVGSTPGSAPATALLEDGKSARRERAGAFRQFFALLDKSYQAEKKKSTNFLQIASKQHQTASLLQTGTSSAAMSKQQRYVAVWEKQIEDEASVYRAVAQKLSEEADEAAMASAEGSGENTYDAAPLRDLVNKLNGEALRARAAVQKDMDAGRVPAAVRQLADLEEQSRHQEQQIALMQTGTSAEARATVHARNRARASVAQMAKKSAVRRVLESLKKSLEKTSALSEEHALQLRECAMLVEKNGERVTVATSTRADGVVAVEQGEIDIQNNNSALHAIQTDVQTKQHELDARRNECADNNAKANRTIVKLQQERAVICKTG